MSESSSFGGGAAGCSCLYHLAQLGWTDAVLLESGDLTSGSTWHAAGHCPTFSTSWGVLKLQRYSAELYRRLASSAEHPINYHVTGSLRLARGRDRLDEFRWVLGMARANGLDHEILGLDALRKHHPFIEVQGLQGALWDPLDGDVDPAQLTRALAKAARNMGSRVRRSTRVTGLRQLANGEWFVSTSRGDITAEVVVNAAGYRAGEVMAMLGRHLPIAIMSHQYLITADIKELAARNDLLPIVRDPDASYYLQQAGHGFALGAHERQATPMWLDGIPADSAFRMWDGDVDRLATYRRDAAARVPLLADAGVRRIVNGPVPYSPDGNPHLGPERGLRNFYHCNTFSFGIAQAGGAGKALAEWVVEGEPEWDLWRLDPRRYTDYATKAYVLSKAIETYQNQYAPAFPFAERPAGRPLRTSPLHDRLRAKGARFGVRGGWERAVCFDPTNATVAGACSFRRRRGWEKLVEAEACAVREAAGILDLPGLAKFQISGRGASAYLDRLVCSRLPSDGQISVSYALNPHGRIASELTITRLAADTFYAVGAAEAEWHDLDLLEGALPRDGSVRLEALSAELGTILLAGPRSREILERVSNADLSDAGFPWLSARHVQIGSTPLLALRVNAVGELGWEFHVPVARLDAVYAELWRAGEECGLRDFGLYAMESLRLEKCYRGWKTELGSDYSPLEASLDRFVEFSKADFVGRAAVMAERERGPLRRLVPLTLDDAGDADAPCRASVFHGRERVGLVTSGGWS